MDKRDIKNASGGSGFTSFVDELREHHGPCHQASGKYLLHGEEKRIKHSVENQHNSYFAGACVSLPSSFVSPFLLRSLLDQAPPLKMAPEPSARLSQHHRGTKDITMYSDSYSLISSRMEVSRKLLRKKEPNSLVEANKAMGGKCLELASKAFVASLTVTNSS